uniref:Ionotropic glutamate receptor C-terminal domain-containing protein n=1 Tax=Plectus sambesii TaxID=2011161 RepID=A0A914WCV7_9BILA
MVHLNIATMVFVPMVFKCGLNTLEPTKDCPHPGISHELLSFLLESMGATHRLIPIRNKTATKGFRLSSDNGTDPFPVGVLKDLQDGKYDMIGFEYEFSLLKANHFNYSYPMQQSSLVFLMKKSKFSFFSRMLLVYKVFHWKVYMVIIGTLAAMVLGLIAARNLLSERPFNASDMEAFIAQNLSGMYEQKVCSGKTLAVLFGLLTILITGLYQGCLLTQLLMPPVAHSFRDFDELIERVASKELTLVTDEEEHSFFEAIRASPVGDYQRLNNAVKMNPVKVFPDTASLLEQLKEDGYVFPCGAHRAKHLIQNECYLQKVVADGFENTWFGFLFTKNSPYISRFNEALIAAQTYAHYVEEKYEKLSDKCTREEKRAVKVGIDPLSLLSLTGLFALLLVGTITGSACFLYELISRQWRRSYVVL